MIHVVQTILEKLNETMVTLISTIYAPHEVLLHTLGEPHNIRQFNKVTWTPLWKAREFNFATTDVIAMFRNECNYF